MMTKTDENRAKKNRETVVELLMGHSPVSYLFTDYGEPIFHVDGEPWNTLLALFFGELFSNIVKTINPDSYVAKTLRGKAKYYFERSKDDRNVIGMIEQLANKYNTKTPKVVNDYFHENLYFENFISSKPISIQDIKELANFLLDCVDSYFP